MTHIKKLLVLFGFVAAAVALAAPDGITLRKLLHEGTESYHIQADMKQTITLPTGGDQDMGVTSTSMCSYKIGTVDAAAGQAPVELTTKIEKFDLDGPLADALNAKKDELLVGSTSTGKIDSLNRYTPDPDKKIDPKSFVTGAANFAYVSPFIQFPQQAVNVGDTWDVVVAKGPTTSKEDQKLTAKLVGEKDVDGKSVYVVSVTGSLKVRIDVGEILKANPVPELQGMADGMMINGTVDISGDGTVDKITGQTLSMSYKLKTQQTTTIPALGDIPSTGTSNIKITLDK